MWCVPQRNCSGTSEMVPRRVRATTRRGGWFVYRVSFRSSHSSVWCVRDVGCCGVGCVIQHVTTSCSEAYRCHHCRHAMLHRPHCSQTSAGIWHRAWPQHHPGVHAGGALASEAADMCVVVVICSITFTWRPPFFVKNHHLTALNKRHHLEWCMLMLQKRKRRHKHSIDARNTTTPGPLSQFFLFSKTGSLADFLC